MRALLAPVLLVLALLIGSAGGGHAPVGSTSGSTSHTLRPGARGDRDVIVSRGAADSLPLLTAGQKTKRGHGATSAPLVLSAVVVLALPGAVHRTSLSLPPASPVGTARSALRARAPPA